jgi:DNA-binding MarR family transcriptional regulator
MSESEPAVPIGMVAARLHRAAQTDCLARLNKAGYTDLRMRHLVLLEALPREGARVTTLAGQLNMTTQAMGELIDELEASGYIERQNDPADRRARLIVFTRKGELAFEKAFLVLGEMERDYAATVGLERYDAARAILDELVVALEHTAR